MSTRTARYLLTPLVALGLLLGCGDRSHSAQRTVIVLGFDGMDPKFVMRHKDRLPNLMRLAKEGGFKPLETVMPPQSPVAWSTVITGLSPGGHGIFDFVHRHPADVTPFSSMAEAVPTDWVLNVGRYSFPLDGSETRTLRQGRAFWEYLADEGIESRILHMPTDFPPLPAATQALSGMGTPDMLGSFGTFQFFSEDANTISRGKISGGEMWPVRRQGKRIELEIKGPVNTYLSDEPRTGVTATVYPDEARKVARIEIADQLLVLAEGEWSDWVRVEFPLVPWMATGHGIVRLFLKQLSPEFQLYVSPVNIDPEAPDVPISQPSSFSADLAQQVGLYYTQGMPEETKGLSAHVITRDEFVEQANLVLDESIAIYHHVLENVQEGFWFLYFSTTDQAAHMLWGKYEKDLLPIYEKADQFVGWTLDRMPADALLLVISDHGFARFDRQVNLNRWLMQEGFLSLDDPDNVSNQPGFLHVDWSKTKAYAMGLNGLYLNRKGREGHGIVTDEEAPGLLDNLEKRLLGFEDPEGETPVVGRVYRTRKIFRGNHLEYAPDLLVGFNAPYRMSPQTGLGAVPRAVVEDNPDEWIGDHCMAHDQVPGVVFSNRPITAEKPALEDVPVTVLGAFGIEPPAELSGESIVQTGR